MRPRWQSSVATGLLVALAPALAALSPAGAAGPERRATPATAYQLPFTCQQEWVGGMRAKHSPSKYAVDFNRAQDAGKPVVAAAAGVVAVSVPKGRTGYGRYVVLDHANGESSLYAHLANVFVTVGAVVDQGALLGTVGETGNVSGAHLHFEQKVGRDVASPVFAGVPFVPGPHASGNCADVPLAGNLEGDRVAELTVYRRTQRGSFVVQQPAGALPRTMPFGGATDEPVLGDWNGDGLLDPGVWSPRGRTFKLATPAGVLKVKLGRRGDRPVAGDWDGNGTWDLGVRRPASGTFWLRDAGGALSTIALGDRDDLPVTGDWNGDGRTDVGVYDRATSVFTVRTADAGGAVTVSAIAFGMPGDLPVPGDWDGDGTTELGTWTPASAIFNQRQGVGPTGAARAVSTVPFGNPR